MQDRERSMKRFGLFGLVFAVSLLGACNDNGGGSGFAIPKDQLGEVNLFIGSPSRKVTTPTIVLPRSSTGFHSDSAPSLASTTVFARTLALPLALRSLRIA